VSRGVKRCPGYSKGPIKGSSHKWRAAYSRGLLRALSFAALFVLLCALKCFALAPIGDGSFRHSSNHQCNCTTLIVGIATAVDSNATAVELAPYGPLGILPVGDVYVEAPRVFKEFQA
jgi:hypothetical protein